MPMTLRLATHASILALIVLGAVAAHRSPMESHRGIGQRPPQGMLYFSPGPVGAAVLVPFDFAVRSRGILDCESPGQAWMAVGDQGRAFGGFQVRWDFHAEAMERAGLDFWKERDRILWSVRLWEDRGQTFKAWSCYRAP